ncbi:MAG: sulfur carrier protein ThiS [Acidobacteria bacterium]|nr:sulfur carrier protein ThiS [Acidobacteriota bacterium]
MHLTVNGDPKTVPEPTSVAQLVQMLELKNDRVAVELNRNIVPRRGWGETALKSGDRLEIVHFVGGG